MSIQEYKMVVERSDNIYEELHNFKVIHGSGSNNFKLDPNFTYVPSISKDVKIIMISNYREQNKFLNRYINSDKIDFTFNNCIILIILNSDNESQQLP